MYRVELGCPAYDYGITYGACFVGVASLRRDLATARIRGCASASTRFRVDNRDASALRCCVLGYQAIPGAANR